MRRCPQALPREDPDFDLRLIQPTAVGVADLNQLAPRDHHLAAGSQLVQSQEYGRGVIVNRDPRRAHQPLQEPGRVRIALPSPSAGQIVFQVG